MSPTKRQNSSPQPMTHAFDTSSPSLALQALLSKPWVHYPKAKQIVDLAHGLLIHPRTTRMPSIAVYGDSGMGKSMIVGRFKRASALSFEASFDKTQGKFLVVELAGGPGERRLYAQILSALDAPLLERFPYAWNCVIEKESLKFKELEHALIEKVAQLF